MWHCRNTKWKHFHGVCVVRSHAFTIFIGRESGSRESTGRIMRHDCRKSRKSRNSEIFVEVFFLIRSCNNLSRRKMLATEPQTAHTDSAVVWHKTHFFNPNNPHFHSDSETESHFDRDNSKESVLARKFVSNPSTWRRNGFSSSWVKFH